MLRERMARCNDYRNDSGLTRLLLKYRLRSEHAAFLNQDRGIDNLAAIFMQSVASLRDVEQKVVQCFRKGGGVTYSAFTWFQQLQAEDKA